jgi:hypothetical protein
VVRAVWERLGSIPVAVASPEPQGLAGAFSDPAGFRLSPPAARRLFLPKFARGQSAGRIPRAGEGERDLPFIARTIPTGAV